MTARARIITGGTTLLALLSLMLWASVAQATAQDRPSLEGDSVVTYDESDRAPLNDAAWELVQGTGSNGDCVFTHAGEVGPDFSGKLVTREVSFDPSTCRAVFETGTLPLDADDVLQYSSGTKNGQWTAYWRDPVNFPVNWNRSNLRWSYDGSTVTAVHSKSCPDYWLTNTGWSRIYDSGCNYQWGENDYEYRVFSSRIYDNTTFPCGFFIRGAQTKILNHILVGDRIGSVEYSTTMQKSGSCSWLLWSETILIVN